MSYFVAYFPSVFLASLHSIYTLSFTDPLLLVSQGRMANAVVWRSNGVAGRRQHVARLKGPSKCDVAGISGIFL